MGQSWIACPNCDKLMQLGGTCEYCGYIDKRNNYLFLTRYAKTFRR